MSLENDAHTKTIRYRVKLESGSLNELKMAYKELCEITKKANSFNIKVPSSRPNVGERVQKL